MRDLSTIRDYCLAKKGVTEGFPFGGDTLVFKVMDKMFALTGIESKPFTLNLKMDKELVPEYRAKYESVQPGWHMSKTHWNTVNTEGADLPLKELYWLIDHSYDEVVKKLTLKTKKELLNL